jgi:hypothetical protein
MLRFPDPRNEGETSSIDTLPIQREIFIFSFCQRTQNPSSSRIKKRRTIVNTSASFYNSSVIKGANL